MYIRVQETNYWIQFRERTSSGIRFFQHYVKKLLLNLTDYLCSDNACSRSLCGGNCQTSQLGRGEVQVDVQEDGEPDLGEAVGPLPSDDRLPTVDTFESYNDDSLYRDLVESILQHVLEGNERPASSAASSSTSELILGHHRKVCWDMEADETQCLNGGSCFAVELHNGMRRAGCSCLSSWTGERCELRYIDPDLWADTDEENIQMASVPGEVCLLFLAIVLIMSIFAFLRYKRQRSIRVHHAKNPRRFHEPRDHSNYETLASTSPDDEHLVLINNKLQERHQYEHPVDSTLMKAGAVADVSTAGEEADLPLDLDTNSVSQSTLTRDHVTTMNEPDRMLFESLVAR